MELDNLYAPRRKPTAGNASKVDVRFSWLEIMDLFMVRSFTSKRMSGMKVG